jgi:hypothetical protein
MVRRSIFKILGAPALAFPAMVRARSKVASALSLLNFGVD